MTKASPLFLAVVLVSTAGLYGCSQDKNGGVNAKLRDMEVRYAKLEEDYHAVVATSEANRKKLAQLEVQKAELAKEVEELKVVVTERDELRKQLVTRTGERDAIQSQLVQFRQDLMSLVGRVDSTLNTPNAGGNPVPASPTSHTAP
jgi:septal ring factor EnvC (AmiA/AmiB activator)